MFTGIVSDVGTVTEVVQRNDIVRLAIATRYEPETIELGASIACGGVCLTVVGCEDGPGGGSVVGFDAAPETLRLTTVGRWQVGDRVNLERSLRVGDELGGHIVAGHVDGIAEVVAREDIGDATRFQFDAPEELSRFVSVKGSVALDGTSLTVNEVDGRQFSCLIIPHTLAVTTWGERQVGDALNIEVDTMARYAARLLEVTGKQTQ